MAYARFTVTYSYDIWSDDDSEILEYKEGFRDLDKCVAEANLFLASYNQETKGEPQWGQDH